MSDICRINKNGNAVIGWYVGGDRYRFDLRVCKPEKGWTQYDTEQDASYFGVWVNIERREIITFAEGDYTLVKCVTNDSMRAELEEMAEFYGDPPPFAVSFDFETGQETHYYSDDQRPTVQP